MRVSLDSNAWEAIFASKDEQHFQVIRSALSAKTISGLVCDTSFRIEAVKKDSRPGYFARPKMGVSFPGDIVESDGKLYRRLVSIGPDDKHHPGLPEVQSLRWRAAIEAGVRLMHGLSWMGLPSPAETKGQTNFVPETRPEAAEREQRQIAVNVAMWDQGFGKAVFDRQGGWDALRSQDIDRKRLIKSCAEWADGELAAAHVAYGCDLLCTNDEGHSAGGSIFGADGRRWLAQKYGVRFCTVRELNCLLNQPPR